VPDALGVDHLPTAQLSLKVMPTSSYLAASPRRPGIRTRTRPRHREKRKLVWRLADYARDPRNAQHALEPRSCKAASALTAMAPRGTLHAMAQAKNDWAVGRHSCAAALISG
jgi:hypothetical protein